MATRMALPAYEFPQNALLDFSGLNRAVDSYNTLRQQGVENARADEQLGMQRTRLGMDQARFAEDQNKRRVERIGNQMKVIDGITDPARRTAMWRSFSMANPDIVTGLRASGIDPDDHMMAPRFLMAEAGAYDPLGEASARSAIAARAAATDASRAHADLYRAQAKKLMAPPAAAPPAADPLAGHGLSSDGTLIAPRAADPFAGYEHTPRAADPFAGYEHTPRATSGGVAAPGTIVRSLPPAMRLGGPKTNVDAILSNPMAQAFSKYRMNYGPGARESVNTEIAPPGPLVTGQDLAREWRDRVRSDPASWLWMPTNDEQARELLGLVADWKSGREPGNPAEIRKAEELLQRYYAQGTPDESRSRVNEIMQSMPPLLNSRPAGMMRLGGPYNEDQFMPVPWDDKPNPTEGAGPPAGGAGRFASPVPLGGQRMNLGGPVDDIEASMRLDEGRGRGGPAGVRMAQAGGGSMLPPLAQQAFGRAGVTSPEVPGIVTSTGRTQRMDVPATREAAGQRAISEASPEQQQRLIEMRTAQRRWTDVFGPARAGYYYLPNGKEVPKADRGYKGDAEQAAIVKYGKSIVDEAFKELGEQSFGAAGRALSGTLGYGANARAFADYGLGAMTAAFTLSGKNVSNFEHKLFDRIFVPQPTDQWSTIEHKHKRLTAFLDALEKGRAAGASPDENWTKAMNVATAVPASGTPPPANPVQQRLKNKYGLE